MPSSTDLFNHGLEAMLNTQSAFSAMAIQRRQGRSLEIMTIYSQITQDATNMSIAERILAYTASADIADGKLTREQAKEYTLDMATTKEIEEI